MSYFVGGNTKVYGAALFRLREKDFEKFHHRDGISPEWPLKYRDFEPYYVQAEKLYQVHGKSGIDTTEPFRSEEYPYPAVSHEPRLLEIQEALVAIPAQTLGFKKGFLVRDPDGHVMRIVEQ